MLATEIATIVKETPTASRDNVFYNVEEAILDASTIVIVPILSASVEEREQEQVDICV